MYPSLSVEKNISDCKFANTTIFSDIRGETGLGGRNVGVVREFFTQERNNQNFLNLGVFHSCFEVD